MLDASSGNSKLLAPKSRDVATKLSTRGGNPGRRESAERDQKIGRGISTMMGPRCRHIERSISMDIGDAGGRIHLELSIPRPQQEFDGGKVFLVHVFVPPKLSPVTLVREVYQR
jgi:hypothetical protein